MKRRIGSIVPGDKDGGMLARQRAALIRELAQQGHNTTEAVQKVADTLELSLSYVYRLLGAFRANPRTSTLRPKTRGRRTGERHLQDEVEQVIDSEIKRVYLQKTRPSIAELVVQIRAKCHALGLTLPHRRTVEARVVAIDHRTITAKRYGARAVRQKFGPVGRGQDVKEILELVQIDHTPVDVIVVDDRTREAFGRPWLSVVIDVASRMILGFYLDMAAPSTTSVAMALAHAVAKKDLWLADRELPFDWPCHGIPYVVHVDNAKEFHSNALEMAADEHGIQLRFRPPGRPEYGGHIERLIGTLMHSVHCLPGTMFSNPQQRGDYDAEAHATMSLSDLERWLALQVNRYHLSIHSTLKTTPLAAWMAGVAQERKTVRSISDERSFLLDFLPGEYRLIRRDGIRLFNLFYWDNVLSPFAGRLKHPVLIKYDPHDLSKVYYKDGEGTYWTIPYRDLGAPPMSLWEHRRAQTELRREGQASFNAARLYETVAQQRKIVEDASHQLPTTSHLQFDDEAPAPDAPESPVDTEQPRLLEPYPIEDWE